MATGFGPLTARLKARAREAGFELAGVTTPEPSAHLEHYRRWVEAGMHGEMAYLARPDAIGRRASLEGTLAGVRSVVVVGHGYGQGGPAEETEDLSQGVIARYARGRDYHKVVKRKLQELARWLEAEAPGGEHRAYVDTGPLLEREMARRAGLGWFGKNTMLIHPRRGSYFFLGVLLTTVELEWDAPFEADRCGSCTACLDACPTGALLGRDDQGAPALDARLCISYLTIEHRGAIAEPLRGRMGNRVYGCDICQEVCPWNSAKLVQVTGERDYRPDWREAGDRAEAPGDLPGTESPSLVELMRMTRDEWDVWTRGSAIRRAGYAGFKRNVAVAIGNWVTSTDGEPPEEAVAVLREALEDEEPLVREHAGWALDRVGLDRA
ncbi:MAG: tRNA epoxyqueuosine(34) reductase QueG [Longimicrobiales bacterium]|nr:tRNA epoxyqueuosine(34) reductase QueG [Longimicrobiales bacterium]